MPSERLGTIEEPDLNLRPPRPPESYERARLYYERANRRLREIGGEVRSDAEIHELAKAHSTPADPAAPRIRVKVDYSKPTWSRTRRDGVTVQHYSGLVEFVNLVGYDYDYRVRLEVADDPRRMRTMAVAVIARHGGPDVMASTAAKGTGAIVKRAARALTRVIEDHEGQRDPRAALSDDLVNDVLNLSARRDLDAPRLGRRSSADVHREVRRVAELWHEYDKEGRSDRSRHRWIAHQMGWIGEERDLARVRKRLYAATPDLVPPASSTRRRG